MTNLRLPCTAAVLLLGTSLAPLCAQGSLYVWSPGGRAVAPVGDVDADGTADFAISYLIGPTTAGGVRFQSGASGALIRRVAGAPLDGFGAAIVGLGDVDQDGHADVAVGAGTYTGFLGYVRLVSGADGGTTWQISGPALGLAFGHSLACVDDLDQDGVPELVVGAPAYGLVSPGRATVRSGASGALLFELVAPGASAEFGRSVESAGDVDGDGNEDVLVGDPRDANGSPGRVTLHSGANGAVLRAFDAPTGCVFFGSSVASVGDQDDDGLRDVLVGAPAAFVQPGLGRALLFSAASGALLRTFVPEANAVWYAQRVGSMRDLDGDGYDELVIQNESHKTGCCTYLPGELRFHSGRTGAELFRGEGHTAAFATVPDANGDGFDDYLVANAAGPEDEAHLVLVHRAAPFPWIGCEGKVSSLGCAPQLEAEGAPSLTLGPAFTVTARRVVPNALGFVGWSTDYQYTPFGGGTLCLLAPVRRSIALTAGSGESPCPGSSQPSGSFAFAISRQELTSLGIPPGDEFFVQAWFRDTGFAPPLDVGLTDALAVQLWP